ncbi:MAG: hypothetical protein AB4426_21965 [Xenococcaceae cyanobacterium]
MPLFAQSVPPIAANEGDRNLVRNGRNSGSKALEVGLAKVCDRYHLIRELSSLDIKDYENMELGLRLLEDTINAIRSRVELEKAERDRLFQFLVTLIGTGTAGVALIDPEGEKCKAILGENFTLVNKFLPCQIQTIKSLVFPIMFILLIGFLGILLKFILVILARKLKL